MKFFHVEMKDLYTGIIPQHTIADLNSSIAFYCFVQSGDTFAVKRNKYKHTTPAIVNWNDSRCC